MHFFAGTTALASMDSLKTNLWDQSLSKVLISMGSVLFAFLVMAIIAFFRARRFLEPLRVISDYSFKKSDQTITSSDVEKETKPTRIPNVFFFLQQM